MTVHIGANGPPIRANTFEPEVLRQILQSVSPTPGYTGAIGGNTEFQVTQNGTPNMTVNVAAGFAFVKGTQATNTQGAYHVYNDATVNLAVAAADPTNPRWDRVVLAVPDAFYSGASNTPVLQIVTGVPNASPALPAAPNNSIDLAKLVIAANATTVVTANITDLRTPSSVWSADRGTLPGGYAEVTADQTGMGTTQTLVTGLSVTITQTAGRRLRINVHMGVNNQVAAANNYVALLQEGATVLQRLSLGYLNTTSSAGDTAHFTGTHIFVPAAGAHTYTVTVAFATGATNIIRAATTWPASIHVEDVGV